MKNTLLTFIVFTSIFSMNAYSDDLSCELLNQFYKLWSDSWFGKDPTREKAAWIIQNPKGNLQWIRWPSSRKWKRESWQGTLPGNITAQVHTHPLNTDPRPSHNDVVLSRNLKTTLYTISRNAIWKVIPNGTITEVARSDWYTKFHSAVCAEQIQLANDNEVHRSGVPMQYIKKTEFAWLQLHQED
jgi:hypothetical protein